MALESSASCTAKPQVSVTVVYDSPPHRILLTSPPHRKHSTLTHSFNHSLWMEKTYRILPTFHSTPMDTHQPRGRGGTRAVHDSLCCFPATDGDRCQYVVVAINHSVKRCFLVSSSCSLSFNNFLLLMHLGRYVCVFMRYFSAFYSIQATVQPMLNDTRLWVFRHQFEKSTWNAIRRLHFFLSSKI